MTVKPTPKVTRHGPKDPGPRAFRSPGLHPTDEHGTYRRRDLPDRNAACPCGSGKKAKRCHPFGLRARVNTLDAAGTGPCTVCGRADVETIPLNHDAVQGTIGRICRQCLKDDPKKALEALLRATRPAPPVPPAPPSVPPTGPPAPAQAAPEAV